MTADLMRGDPALRTLFRGAKGDNVLPHGDEFVRVVDCPAQHGQTVLLNELGRRL